MVSDISKTGLMMISVHSNYLGIFPCNDSYFTGQKGRGREHTKELIRFLSISNGSLAELEAHLILASRLGYVSEEKVNVMLGNTAEVGRMLNGFMRSLHQKE